VKTYFTTDAATLTQHVEHNVEGVVYPVTADPYWYWGWNGVYIYYDRFEMAMGRIAIAGVASALRIPYAVYAAMIAQAIDEASGGQCIVVFKSYWSWNASVWLRNC